MAVVRLSLFDSRSDLIRTSPTEYDESLYTVYNHYIASCCTITTDYDDSLYTATPFVSTIRVVRRSTRCSTLSTALR